MSGSPNCSIDRTFTSTFNFSQKTTKTNQIVRIYRNPIYLARVYKEMIKSGKAKNQSKLAQLKDISRARFTQILNLLKLDKNIITRIEKIGDPTERRIVSERQLRDLNIIY